MLVTSKRKNNSGVFMEAPLSPVSVEAIDSRDMLGAGKGKVNVRWHSSSVAQTQPASPRCCLSAVQAAAAAASSRSSFLTPDGRLARCRWISGNSVRRRLSLLFAPSLVFLLCGALPFPEVPTRPRRETEDQVNDVGCGKYLGSDIHHNAPLFQQILGNILAVFMLLRPFLQRNRTPIILF